MKTVSFLLAGAICFNAGLQLHAATSVGLQQATATFSQTGFSVANVIDGTTDDELGWAIDPQENTSPTAVFETTSDVGYPGGSLLTFTLNHAYDVWGGHMLGRFRISVTTDDRSTFADGLASGGDVKANWIILDPLSFTSANGETLTEQSDHSILVSGPLLNTDVYTITAATTLTKITGIRLEALTDPSLPHNGPGRQPANGNFVLSEFSVDIDHLPPPNPVALQEATATFSQTDGGDFSVGRTINGTTADGLGWAISPEIGAQTAAYETTSDIGYASGSMLTFTLDQSYSAWSEQLLGCFRISVTTDDRSTFCDGLLPVEM